LNPTKTKRVNSIVPLIIFGLIAVIVLVASLLSQRPAAEAEEASRAETTAEATAETEAGSGEETIDLTRFERRDAGDLLAAGPVDAPVGLIVFSDYQCPFCGQWNYETLPTMMEYAERGDLRIEWRDLNVFGPESERASYASYAAALQGKFWEYHEALYPNGDKRAKSELSEESLIALAGELGLDTERFAIDMTSDATRAEIERNQQLGYSLGAASTPVFLLGGVPISGAQPTEVFVQVFEDALAKQS
jgi:protein-disulfide isomerase